MQPGQWQKIILYIHKMFFISCFKSSASFPCRGSCYTDLVMASSNSVRIGNELGAGHPRVARFAVIVVVSTCVILSLIISALVLILRTPLSELYTDSTDVIKAVSNLTPLLAISIFLNGIQPILSGKIH